MDDGNTKTQFYLIPPKSLSFSQYPKTLNSHCKKTKKEQINKEEATETEPNQDLFRKEDDEVGAAVGEERQDRDGGDGDRGTVENFFQHFFLKNIKVFDKMYNRGYYIIIFKEKTRICIYIYIYIFLI